MISIMHIFWFDDLFPHGQILTMGLFSLGIYEILIRNYYNGALIINMVFLISRFNQISMGTDFGFSKTWINHRHSCDLLKITTVTCTVSVLPAL